MAARNDPAITERVRIGELLRAIWGYHSRLTTEYALKIRPHVLVRPENFGWRSGRSLIEGAMWRARTGQMKMNPDRSRYLRDILWAV